MIKCSLKITQKEQDMYFERSVIYQIYPLGFCNAPAVNDGKTEHRLSRIADWAEHIKRLGADCIMLNPLFESDAHGYDTRDFFRVDRRLGDNTDLKELCVKLHSFGFKIIFDGVFNHVGRGFWAFEDVRQKKASSQYKDWFHISFDGNSPYNDGFWYEGWEGHFELVKLNLFNRSVKDHIFSAVRSWIEDYDIDGLRLDVAYSLEPSFLSEFRRFTSSLKNDFVLIGETLHGDYKYTMNDNACHSATNYECYKGLYSSFNCGNMHEISYSLNRQFGSDPWCLYTGKHLLNFVDNHDVSRIASILNDKNELPVIYGLLFAMPGVPSVYYGSEWGAEGEKKDGDRSLRPSFDEPSENDLYHFISKLAAIRRSESAILYGDYKNIFVSPKQLAFERSYGNEKILVAINSDNVEVNVGLPFRSILANELISGKSYEIDGTASLPPYSISYLKLV